MFNSTVKCSLICLVLSSCSGLNAQTDSQWFTAQEGYTFNLGNRRLQIMATQGQANPYQPFAGNSMVSTFGKASVAFNPDDL